MMNSQYKVSRFAVALGFVGVMFFAIGFALGINSFLLPVLRSSLEISSRASYLILTATFLPFLVFSYPAAMTIKAIGYKRTMALSFAMFAVAFSVFIPAASLASFPLFLLASLLSGTANCFLQVSVNPYVTILGPIESAAKRMSIMGICNKLAWPIAPSFLAFIIGKNINDTLVTDLSKPFFIIIIIFLLLGVMALLAPLPEVTAKGEEEDESAAPTDKVIYADNKTSIRQFPHLVLGAIALFFYVGVETIALSSLVDYADWLGYDNAKDFGWLSSIGMVVGYICGIALIPRYLSQQRALYVCSVVAIIGSLLVVLLPPAYSIWALALVALGCSLMWPAVWPLAMADLGRFTKTGASLLTTAIAGGAVIPLIFGWMKDLSGSMQQAYWIALPCFLFILYYAVSGYKIRR